jgi:hypothetical protein
MRFGWSEPEGAKMASTTTPAGTTVVCHDQVGNVITGVLVDVMPGECRGGGIASVKAIWPGKKRASVQMVELADVEVAA